ncbi:hypothetical protein ACFLXP_05460 [Chloroflexota bacterium]
MRSKFINGTIILMWAMLISLASSCIPIEPGVTPLNSEPTPDESYPKSFLELRKTASSPSYDDLLRYNERFIGELVYYKAEILQFFKVEENIYDCRAYITGEKNLLFWDENWDDPVFIRNINFRLSEDDLIEFVGEVKGLNTTKRSVVGLPAGMSTEWEVTIPEIDVIEAVIITKTGSR